MTFGQDRPRDDRPTAPTQQTRKRSPLIPTLIVVAVLVVGFVFFSQIYADILWYHQLGYLEVFLKENGTKIAIFLIAFLIISGLPGTAEWAIGLLVGINLVLGGASLVGMALAARKS